MALARAAGGQPVAPPPTLPLFGESTFGVTSTSTVRWRGENDDRNPFDDQFLSLGQRFDLVLQGETLRFDLRLDGFLPTFPLDGVLAKTPANSTLFTRKCNTDAQCYLAPLATPERALLRWDHDEFTLELGDAYAVLGRGLVLSFRKADLLGVDDALRGGHVRWDDGKWLLTAHAGVSNPQNLDPTNLAVTANPLDVVGAAEVARKLGEDDALEVGLHGSGVMFEDLLSRTGLAWDREVISGGFRASAPALLDGALSLYLEGNLLHRAITFATSSRTETGHALYVSAQFQGTQLTALGEWVDYGNFVIARDTLEGTAARIYSALPILELDGLQRVRAPANRRGGKLKADWALDGAPWIVSANALALGFDEDGAKDPWDGVLVMHAWAGLKRFNSRASGGELAWTFEAIAGARRETYLHDPADQDVGKGDVDRQAVHGELSASVATGQHSLEAKLEHRMETEHRFGGYVDFIRGGLTLTYTWALAFSVSPILRWNNEREDIVARRVGRLTTILGPELYPALEARWNFTTGDFVSIFLGSTPAGRLCSGGVCRDVQSYEGVVAQLVLRG